MRVSTDGRVTIPKGIRERLGLHPGTEVQFEVVGDAVRIALAKPGAAYGRRIVEHLRGRGTIRLTTDEIMALTRGAPVDPGRRAP